MDLLKNRSYAGGSTIGGATTRHWLETPLAAFTIPEMAAGPLVNAGGLPAQLAFVCVGMLVTPLMMKSQTWVPAAIPTFERLIKDGCVNVTIPEQPGERVTVGVAVKRRPVGSVSVKAIPVCNGEPEVLNSLKESVVLSPGLIDSAPNTFVKVGGPASAPTVAVTALLVID